MSLKTMRSLSIEKASKTINLHFFLLLSQTDYLITLSNANIDVKKMCFKEDKRKAINGVTGVTPFFRCQLLCTSYLNSRKSTCGKCYRENNVPFKDQIMVAVDLNPAAQ